MLQPALIAQALAGEPAVLTPDEFADLRAAVEGVDLDRRSVYGAEDGGGRIYVIVAAATGAGPAVVVPTFILPTDLPALRQRAEAAALMDTHVRTLSLDEYVPFRHDDPDLFWRCTSRLADVHHAFLQPTETADAQVFSPAGTDRAVGRSSGEGSARPPDSPVSLPRGPSISIKSETVRPV